MNPLNSTKRKIPPFFSLIRLFDFFRIYVMGLRKLYKKRMLSKDISAFNDDEMKGA